MPTTFVQSAGAFRDISPLRGLIPDVDMRRRRWHGRGQVMTRLGLTVKRTEDALRNARQEHFDFLGYSFGRTTNEGWSLVSGASPSQKSVATPQMPWRRSWSLQCCSWEDVRTRLNSLLRGWAIYFSYGTRLMAIGRRTIMSMEAVRGFMTRRHKVPSREAHGVYRTCGLWKAGRAPAPPEHIGARRQGEMKQSESRMREIARPF